MAQENNSIFTPAEKRPRLLICSKAGDGKTTLLTNLMLTVYHGEFHNVIVFSHKSNEKFFKAMQWDPAKHRIARYSDAALLAAYEAHMEMKQEYPDYRTLFILDDCGYAPDFKQNTNKGVLNEAFGLWREHDVSFIILVQDLNSCSLGVRNGARQFIIFYGSNIGSNIDRITESQYFGSKREFKKLFSKIPNKYSFLIIDKDENKVIQYDNDRKKYSCIYDHAAELAKEQN